MEVETFEERISQLTTIHPEVGDSFDWGEIVNQPPPAYPVKNDKMWIRDRCTPAPMRVVAYSSRNSERACIWSVCCIKGKGEVRAGRPAF